MSTVALWMCETIQSCVRSTERPDLNGHGTEGGAGCLSVGQGGSHNFEREMGCKFTMGVAILQIN